MRIISLIKENPALSLVLINVLLLVLLLLPETLITWQDDTFLEVEKNEITGLHLQYGQMKASLERLDEKVPAEGADDSKEMEYLWKLVLDDGRSYQADAERMRELLRVLTSMRSQYSLPLEGEARATYQLGNDAVRLTIEEDGDRRVLLIGKASQRSNSTYVLVEGQDEIHEVDVNLRSRLGSGDELYFRNRDILPSDLNTGNVSSLAYLEPGLSVRMARAGSEWQMVEPHPGKLRDDMFRPILDDILRWKARSFPDAIPADARREPARIELTYQKGSTEPGVVQLDIEAVGEGGIYYVRYNDTLYAVSSYYLEDLKSPESLLDRGEVRLGP